MQRQLSGDIPSEGRGAANAGGPARMGLRPKSVNDERPLRHRSIVGRILATGRDIDKRRYGMDPVRRRILARVKESRSNLRMPRAPSGGTRPVCTSSSTAVRPECSPGTTGKHWPSTWVAAPKSCGTTGLRVGTCSPRRLSPCPGATAPSTRSTFALPRARGLERGGRADQGDPDPRLAPHPA